MRLPTFEEIITFAVLALLLYAGWYFVGRIGECEARGGTMVRTVATYECVALIRR